MQPKTLLAAYPAKLGQRIKAIRGGSAHRGRHKARLPSRLAVLRDLPRQRLGPHRKAFVHFHEPQVRAAQPGHLHRLLYRRMRLRRGVGHQLSVTSPLIRLQPGGPFARCQQSAQHAARRRILNNPAPGPGRLELLRQPEHCGHPIEHVRLKLGAGGAGGPQHALHPQTRGDQFPQDGRPRIIRGKEGKEVGRLPVSDTWNDQSIHVGEDGLKRFAALRRLGRQRGADLSRLDA